MKKISVIWNVDRCAVCPMLEKGLFKYTCTHEGLTVSKRYLDTFPPFCESEEEITIET